VLTECFLSVPSGTCLAGQELTVEALTATPEGDASSAGAPCQDTGLFISLANRRLARLRHAAVVLAEAEVARVSRRLRP